MACWARTFYTYYEYYIGKRLCREMSNCLHRHPRSIQRKYHYFVGKRPQSARRGQILEIQILN